MFWVRDLGIEWFFSGSIEFCFMWVIVLFFLFIDILKFLGGRLYDRISVGRTVVWFRGRLLFYIF